MTGALGSIVYACVSSRVFVSGSHDVLVVVPCMCLWTVAVRVEV